MLRDKVERKTNQEKDKKNNNQENDYYIWYKQNKIKWKEMKLKKKKIWNKERPIKRKRIIIDFFFNFFYQKCHRGHARTATSFGDKGGSYRASCVRYGVLEKFLDLIIKLWLMFRSSNLVLWLLGTYGLRESR
jgi:hypothetical protein